MRGQRYQLCAHIARESKVAIEDKAWQGNTAAPAGAKAAGLFTNTGLKNLYLKFDWEWLHTIDTESMHVAPESLGTGNMVGPIFDIGPNSAAYDQAKGKATFQFGEVDCIVF